MSGHSRWSNIQRNKGIQDQKRSGIFTKLAKNISVAAKDGKDPDMNFKLRLAIEKAKQFNMPKSNIEKAIAKGAGETSEAAPQEVVYEGYGPAGIAAVIEATTDNKNRTASNIRSIFSKNGGSLGAVNSVMWMFDKAGIFKINKDLIKDTDEFILELIDAGAKDVQIKDNQLVIFSEIEKFQSVKEFLDKKNIEPNFSEIEYVPKTEIEITNDEDKAKIQKFVDVLLDDEDVNNVFLNIK